MRWPERWSTPPPGPFQASPVASELQELGLRRSTGDAWNRPGGGVLQRSGHLLLLKGCPALLGYARQDRAQRVPSRRQRATGDEHRPRNYAEGRGPRSGVQDEGDVSSES